MNKNFDFSDMANQYSIILQGKYDKKYCISSTGDYYYIEEIKKEIYCKFTNSSRMTEYFTLTKCKVILFTVDVVARDPDHSKEYDRFNVYDLEPIKEFEPIKIYANYDLYRQYRLYDGYVYEKIMN